MQRGPVGDAPAAAVCRRQPGGAASFPARQRIQHSAKIDHKQAERCGAEREENVLPSVFFPPWRADETVDQRLAAQEHKDDQAEQQQNQPASQVGSAENHYAGVEAQISEYNRIVVQRFRAQHVQDACAGEKQQLHREKHGCLSGMPGGGTGGRLECAHGTSFL